MIALSISTNPLFFFKNTLYAHRDFTWFYQAPDRSHVKVCEVLIDAHRSCQILGMPILENIPDRECKGVGCQEIPFQVEKFPLDYFLTQPRVAVRFEMSEVDGQNCLKSQ